jgi:F0F1-type ATP synthase membrane subunit b/b'
MFYVILVLVILGLMAAALYFFFRCDELSSQLRHAADSWEAKERDYTSELDKLEKIRHIPDIIERARRSKEQVEANLAEAQRKGDEIVERAFVVARELSSRAALDVERKMAETGAEIAKKLGDAEAIKAEAGDALKAAKMQARTIVEESQSEAREITSKARKEAKEKNEKADAVLNSATIYALAIRQKAEQDAREIAGEAYDARGKLEHYEATAHALQNRIKKYDGVYTVPPTHLLDELADAFGFSNAAEKLKLARERTRMMQANGTAATCGYEDGWKKEHALKFVLSTFNGKVDTVLSRVKPNNQGKLIQEIKDAYALVN